MNPDMREEADSPIGYRLSEIPRDQVRSVLPDQGAYACIQHGAFLLSDEEAVRLSARYRRNVFLQLSRPKSAASHVMLSNAS